jgi:hypothetical protein
MRQGWLVVVLLLGSAAACAEDSAAPDWMTSTLYEQYGEGDRVPLPWEPVEVRGREVRVWGRSFRWDERSLLPASIISQGAELLAEPLALRVGRGGAQQCVPLDDLRVLEVGRARVALQAVGQTDGLRVTADLWVEYDGFLWLTLRLTDAVAGRLWDTVRLEARLPREHARLYQTHALALAGWVGDGPVRFAWRVSPDDPVVNFYHWIGSEDRGLGFTYSTLEHWAPLSEEAFAELVPDEAGVTYRANLVERPVTLDGRRFELGLQATPIKPLPPDYSAMLATTQEYAPWKAWLRMPGNVDMTLVWPLDTGIMKGLNDPWHVKPEAMQDVVRFSHERGVAELNVAACPQKVSPSVDGFGEWIPRWRVEPESTLDWQGEAQVQNCAKPLSLRKWLFEGWAVQNVLRFGLDGLYFDGWQGGTMGCQSAAHGCGWTDETGGRHLTVPVLEGREFNQRLLLFLQDRVQGLVPASAPERPGFPRCHLWIHSWTFVPSVMGFATEWLTGEFAGWPDHGPSMLTPEGTYGKCLGLGLFRARCLSTNWGVPNLFDALMWEAEEKCPTDRQTLMAYAWFLPHGVPVGMLGYMNQETVVALNSVLSDFNTRRAAFTPGWRPNPWWVVTDPAKPEVMVATWDRAAAQGRVLAVVSNLQAEGEQAVRLRWKGEGTPTLRDARSGEALGLEDGELALTLGPETFRLVWAEVGK